MSFSHRTRLVLASAGSSGVLFASIFVVVLTGLHSGEVSDAQDLLRTAVNHVVRDYMEGEPKPDLAEVVEISPGVTLSVFDSAGRLVEKNGSLPIPYTHQSGLSNGLVLESEVYQGYTVIGGLDWSHQEALIDHFRMVCILLWFPLVCVVALSTWITARSTFQPLSTLAREAESLSVEDLSARLHVDNSGEYREFTQRLNRFLERLEASVRREEFFISEAAHELRTPLTVLRGQVESALRRSRTDEEYRSTLAMVLDETNRLSVIVELLLRSATPLDGSTPESDLSRAVESAHARWVDRFSLKDVRLELSLLSVNVVAEATELDVVLDNLLANALRASKQGSSCLIAIEKGSNEGILKVSDEGIGISRHDAERIFERFARLSNRTEADSGFGIGLALCKRIVESRQGCIWAEENTPNGATLSVSLPLS